MSSADIFIPLGDFILWTTEILFENIGNMFNNMVIVLGFIGLFIWLRFQHKFNQEAKNNPDQLK
tara:strand:- start:216342 stop:216533 length:192 start_codon:yes stop_codon:yes gene_type:complete